LCYNSIMPALTVDISPEAREKLAQRAAAAGKDVAVYAAEIIEGAATQPTLDELLAPAREAFARSCMTEDELSELLEEAKHRRRAERRQAGPRP
jgi:hypothetical protein